jgi:hypothetical protein
MSRDRIERGFGGMTPDPTRSRADADMHSSQTDPIIGGRAGLLEDDRTNLVRPLEAGDRRDRSYFRYLKGTLWADPPDESVRSGVGSRL